MCMTIRGDNEYDTVYGIKEKLYWGKIDWKIKVTSSLNL